SERARARPYHPHVVAQRLQFATDRVGYERFDVDVAPGERSLGEPAGFESLLNVQAEVDDIADELGVGLGLIESAHDPEPDLHATFFHEGRDDRVKRPFARR